MVSILLSRLYQVHTAEAALELVELAGIVGVLVVVGVEVLVWQVIWVGGLAVVVGKVVLHEVPAVLLRLVEAVSIWIGVGVVVHHHVLIGLVHWVGKQSLDLEGLLD